MASGTAETIIGAVVLAIAGGFIAYTMKTTDIGSNGGNYSLFADFRKAEGLTVGGDVKISGVKIGSIRSLDLNPSTFMARVTLSIKDEYKLPEDSSAKIASEGLLGGSFVAIDPGGAEEMLESGQEIEYTQSSINFLDIIGKAISGSKSD